MRTNLIVEINRRNKLIVQLNLVNCLRENNMTTYNGMALRLLKYRDDSNDFVHTDTYSIMLYTEYKFVPVNSLLITKYSIKYITE